MCILQPVVSKVVCDLKLFAACVCPPTHILLFPHNYSISCFPLHSTGFLGAKWLLLRLNCVPVKPFSLCTSTGKA